MYKRVPQLAAALLVVLLCVFTINTVRVSAFADTNFFDYPNQSSPRGPNFGRIWGSNYADGYTSGWRAIQAEQKNILWNSTTLSALQNADNTVGPVFHLFRYDSNQPNNTCAARFDADGYTEGSAGYSWFSKSTTCGPFDPVQNNKNEARVFWNVYSLSSNISYYGGVEFRGYLVEPTDKVSNDVYYNAANEPHDGGPNEGTWRYDNSGGAYAC